MGVYQMDEHSNEHWNYANRERSGWPFRRPVVEEQRETITTKSEPIPEICEIRRESSELERSDSLSHDSILAGAVQELRRIENDLSLAEKERQERLSVFVARVYMVSMAGHRDIERHKRLISKSGIKTQKNTPHHKQTLRAVLKLAGLKLVKQTEHDCYQVLDGLEESGVAEEESAVLGFFSESAEFEGQRVTGFARAKAARQASQRLKDEREARLVQAKVEQDEVLRAVVANGEKNRLGAIDVANADSDLSSDLWISINRGHHVLAALEMTTDQLRSIVVKHTNQK